MKIGIQQGVLLKALEKGAVAAMSDVAQSDTSNMALLIKSVKITVDKDFTVESSTNMMSVKYSVPANKDDGIVVTDAGCVLVPAKELIDWTKKQAKEATINIVYGAYNSPEMITAADGDSDDSFAIKKVGEIKAVCKNNSQSHGTSKWSLSCYDPTHIKSVDFDTKSPKQFEIKAPSFAKAMKTISFASLPKDYEHVLDSISIQTYKDSLYFATTDTKRCALYKPDDVTSLKSDKSILVAVSLMDQVVKISDEANTLTFYYDEKANRVFVSQPSLEVRLTSALKEDAVKFPNIKMLLDKKYDLLAEVDKREFFRLLENAALVNSSSSLFSFSDKDGAKAANCGVKAISESSKHDPLIYTIHAEVSKT
ncbi:MAG: hypothetical protein WC375_08525, partial [Methanomassiliicoccales archaeon]